VRVHQTLQKSGPRSRTPHDEDERVHILKSSVSCARQECGACAAAVHRDAGARGGAGADEQQQQHAGRDPGGDTRHPSQAPRPDDLVIGGGSVGVCAKVIIAETGEITGIDEVTAIADVARASVPGRDVGG
jgi:hypothetical protein